MSPHSVVRSSLLDVAQSWRHALHVGLLPRLAVLAASAAILPSLRRAADRPHIDPLLEQPWAVPGWLPGLASSILLLLGWCWTAVAWHRLVILGEPPRLLLILRTRAFWLYALYALPVTAGSLFMGLVIAARLTSGRGQGWETIDAMLRDRPAALDPRMVAILVVSAFLWLILAAFLPGRATDRPLDIGDGVRLASKPGWAVVHPSLAVAAVLLLASLTWSLLDDLPPLVALGLVLAADAGAGVVVAAILTRLHIAIRADRPPSA